MDVYAKDLTPTMENTLLLIKKNVRKRILMFGSLAVAVFLSACSPAPHAVGFNDPNEAANRRMHKANIVLDRTVLKPVSKFIVGRKGDTVLFRGVRNFSSNMSMPSTILNDFLQAKIGNGFSNTFRFAMNTTIGLGGLFDVATPNGLVQKENDFGQTLYVWGIPEGQFVELPLLGPSTVRNTVGTAVDLLIDPVNHFIPTPRRYIVTAAKVVTKVGDRGRFSDTVDSVLYHSEDSYAQTRLIYLQHRRQKLYGGLMEADLEDPYAQ